MCEYASNRSQTIISVLGQNRTPSQPQSITYVLGLDPISIQTQNFVFLVDLGFDLKRKKGKLYLATSHIAIAFPLSQAHLASLIHDESLPDSAGHDQTWTRGEWWLCHQWIWIRHRSSTHLSLLMLPRSQLQKPFSTNLVWFYKLQPQHHQYDDEYDLK